MSARKWHNLTTLTEADVIAARLEEPTNCELHIGLTEQRILHDILLDAAEREWIPGHQYVLDQTLAALSETIIFPVK